MNTLPIPAWDLRCPRCGYLLNGLPSHVCPECGTRVNLAALLRPWTRLREPRFTGRESPLPDFGLRCQACGAALAGSVQRTCRACGRRFDPESFRPKSEWFPVDSASCGGLPVAALEGALAAEGIPYYAADRKGLLDLHLDARAGAARLMVRSEFCFDFLHLLCRIRSEIGQRRAAPRGRPWRCGSCGERVPAHFEVCWNCQAARGASLNADS